jgi:hypothetical protein
MTRAEYFARQKALSVSRDRAWARQERLIREAHRELYAPVIAAVLRGEKPEIDKTAVYERLMGIIQTESVKPALEAEILQEEMEAGLLGRLGITAPERRENEQVTLSDLPKMEALYKERKISLKRWVEFLLAYHAAFPEAALSAEAMGMLSKAAGAAVDTPVPLLTHTPRREETGRPVTYTGRGWAASANPRKGVTSYRKDPDTGKIIWDTAPIEWTFRKRYDLSSAVWKSVEENEGVILDIARGGRAMGRDVKDIAKDLEVYIKYPDGGARVQGRWKGMFPNTEKGRREAWKREYLKEHPDPLTHEPYQYGTQEAGETLSRPEARNWIEERMAEKTAKGTPLRPEGVERYNARLGKGGLDYRATRLARTETAEALSSRQQEIARNSRISTGEMDWVLDATRDHWNCKCEEYANAGRGAKRNKPWKADELPGFPPHPNCCCSLRPHILTDAEIKQRLDEEDQRGEQDK